MNLICPKCQNLMTQYERSGVVVDQCTECRGLFLDRGELERLSAAEQAWHTGGPGVAPAPGGDPRYQDHPDQYGYSDRHGHHGHHGRRHKRRRGSFLENLFDFGD